MTNGNDWAYHDSQKVWGYSDTRGEYCVDNENTPLTKREHFAAMAMQGLITNDATPDLSLPSIAYAAVRHADALIEALNK